jgi:predicted SnoaL-like aldol condensation-catalyzing enzyme
VLITFGAAIALVAGITPAAAAAPKQPQAASSRQLETFKEAANKGVVLALYDALNRGNFSFISRAMRPDLIQHRPEIADGSAGFRAYESGLRKKSPKLHYSVERVIVEGDLVVVHSDFVAEPGALGLAEMDLFKLQHGKIVEQWGASQDVVPSTSVGNDMFSTLSSPKVAWPTALSTASSSKRAAEGVFADAINQPEETPRDQALEHYIGDNTYFQHFPGIPNGVDGVKQFLNGLYGAYPAYRADVRVVIAEGDLAFMFSHLVNFADDPGSFAGDLFRVRDGKLLEHWSVTQAVPATSANPNPMY